MTQFDEGLRLLQQVNDYASIKDLIVELVGMCPPTHTHLAKDRIARILRKKQAVEIHQSKSYPDALAALDKKYNDLAVVLRHATSSPEVAQQKPSQITKAPSSGLMGFGLKPLMLINWAKEKRETIIKGAAVATLAGGAYYMIQKYFGGGKSKEERETSFDQTIKSIQKYRACTKLASEPNFGNEYLELLDEKPKKGKNKGRKKEKEEESSKLDEWEREEQSLIRKLDSAHRAIEERPNLNAKIPSLPAPKKVSADGIFDKNPEEPKKRKKFKAREVEENSDSSDEIVIEKEVKPKAKRGRKKKAKTSVKIAAKSEGRLIPIVKRTKRVKKIS